MTINMKTLREALPRLVVDPSLADEKLLSAALDELEALRGQRDELLAALEVALGRCERCRDKPYGDCADCYDDRKTVANARGDK